MIVDPKLRVLLFGGDERWKDFLFKGADIQAFPSTKYGGNGSLDRIKATIKGGTVDLVILLSRWLGHPEADAVKCACLAAGIPVITVRGSQSAVRRELDAFRARRRSGLLSR